jgi:hypothetical protein
MIASHIEDQVEWTIQALHSSNITGNKLCVNLTLVGFFPCYPDRWKCIINPNNFPTMAGQVDHIGTGSAACIEGSTGGMALDELD